MSSGLVLERAPHDSAMRRRGHSFAHPGDRLKRMFRRGVVVLALLSRLAAAHAVDPAAPLDFVPLDGSIQLRVANDKK